MFLKNIVLSLGISALFLSCASNIEVAFDYDKEQDFKPYKTYARLTDNVPVNVDDDLLILGLPGDELYALIDVDLQKKGFILDEEDPDFVVLAHFGLKEKMDVTDKSDNKGSYPVGSQKIEVEFYSEGSLVLDIIDVERVDLIWRGVATKKIEDEPTEDKAKKNVKEALKKILAGFPPKAK